LSSAVPAADGLRMDAELEGNRLNGEEHEIKC
jgi:hypothetical protein